jgi:HK97 family phage major capsid protein
MTQEENAAAEKALLDKVNKEATDAVTKFTDEYKEIATKAAEGKMTKAEVDNALGELEKKSKEFTNEQFKVLNDELSSVKVELTNAAAELKALKEVPNKGNEIEKIGFGTLFRKSLEKEELIEEVILDPLTGKKAITVKGWNRNDLKIQTKAAINMTTALTQLPGATPGTSIGYLTDYSKMQDVQVNLTKDTPVINIFPTDPITGEYMGVLIEYDYFDGAAVTVEGVSPVASSIKFKTLEYKVFDYSAKVRVHKNMLRDMPRLESKLNRVVPVSILQSLDSAVFSTGGDNSTSAYGLYYAGNYVAFDATDLGKVAGATIVDLIGKMVLQANNADQDVNTVILHPSLLNGLRHAKNQLDDSLTDRNVVFDSMGNVVSIWGLAIKLNKKQTINRVTVLWEQAAEIGVLEDVSMEMGTDGNDFSEGYRTLMFVMRAAFGVSKPGAIFVSTNPTNDIASIDSGI